MSDAEFRDALRVSAQIPPRPDIWVALVPIYQAWHVLGRDMNGVTLYSERVIWLDRNMPEGEREAGELLFAVLEGIAAEIHRELNPLPEVKK